MTWWILLLFAVPLARAVPNFFEENRGQWPGDVRYVARGKAGLRVARGEGVRGRGRVAHVAHYYFAESGRWVWDVPAYREVQLDAGQTVRAEEAGEYHVALGGSGADEPLALHVNASGEVTVVGLTASLDFAPGRDRSRNGADVFVSRLNAAATEVVETTYLVLGGTAAAAIGTDGAAYVHGVGFANRTRSFLWKLAPGGREIVYRTQLTLAPNVVSISGSGEVALGSERLLAFDTAGVLRTDVALDRLSVAAMVHDRDGFLRVLGDQGGDVAVLRVDPVEGRVITRRSFGGGGLEASASLAVDAAGNTVILGTTQSNNLPVRNALQPRSGRGVVYRVAADASAWRRSDVGLAGDVRQVVAAGGVLYARDGVGVFRSTDGGENWTAIPIAGAEVRRLLARADAEVLYADTDRGLYATSDRGATWTRRGTPPYPVLAIDPANPQVLHAWPARSDDGGVTWVTVGSAGASQAVLVHPLDPRVVYAMVATGPATFAIRRSADGGVTWTNGVSFSSRGPATPEMVLDRVSLTTVWVLNYGLDRSADGGQTFALTSLPCCVSALLAAGQDVVAGSTQGLYRSSDGGSTWRSFGSGLEGNTVQSLGVGLDGSLWAAASLFSGRNATNLDAFVARFAADGELQFATYLGGLGDEVGSAVEIAGSGEIVTVSERGTQSVVTTLRSDGGVVAWSRVAGVAAVQATALDGAGGVYLLGLAGTADRDLTTSVLQRGSDGGRSWTGLDVGGLGRISVLSADPAGTGRVLLSTTVAGRSLFRSLDGGVSWADVNRDLRGAGPVTAVAWDPSESTRVYIGTSGTSVWVSGDGGETWRSYGVQILAGTVQRLVRHGRLLYATTQAGIFVSDVEEEVWSRHLGIANAAFYVIHPADERVRFAGNFEVMNRSGDGGLTWETLRTRGGGPIAFDSRDPQRVAMLTSRGLDVSEDGGVTWRAAGAGLPAALGLELLADPSRPGVLYAATLDGFYRSEDFGETWEAAGSRAALLSATLMVRDGESVVLTGGQKTGGDVQLVRVR